MVLAITVVLYRTDPARLLHASRRLTALLQHPIVAGGLLLVLLEVNMLVFLLLQNIAPTITGPAKFLLVSWSLLLAGIIITVNQARFTIWLKRTRIIWMATGLITPALILFLALFFANQGFVRMTGLEDRLRGGLDYRDLAFYDDGQIPPEPPQYWQEQAQTRVRWSPYTYWVMSAFDGEFITIKENGLRETPQYTTSNTAQQIYVFGGSTVWGEGARDAYTIPGHLSRLLFENDTPQIVQNYGQSGYVSMQDMLWFQMQLLNDNTPDIAIFYQGFNDVLAAAASDYTGVTLQEEMRLNDSEAGRILRAGQPLFRLPDYSLDDYDMSRAAVKPATPEAIASRWIANAEMIQHLAEAYGVEVLFIWQPAIIYKNTLSANEQVMYNRTLAERPAVLELYEQVDPLVRERIAESDLEHVLILSDLFAEVDDELFIDLVHITEAGNARVAEAILPELNNLLRQE
jgi:lysophospholipase L1-like esterase